jgi:hypothetical protein
MTDECYSMMDKDCNMMHEDYMDESYNMMDVCEKETGGGGLHVTTLAVHQCGGNI